MAYEQLPAAISQAFQTYWGRKEARKGREHELEMMREQIEARADLSAAEKQAELDRLDLDWKRRGEAVTEAWEREAPGRKTQEDYLRAQTGYMERMPQAPAAGLRAEEQEDANWINLRIDGEDRIKNVLNNPDMPYMQFKMEFPGAKMLTKEQYANARKKGHEEAFFEYLLSAAGEWMISQATTMGYKKETAYTRLPNEYLTLYDLEGKFTGGRTSSRFTVEDIKNWYREKTPTGEQLGRPFKQMGAAIRKGVGDIFGAKETIAEPLDEKARMLEGESILEQKRRLQKKKPMIDWSKIRL